MFIQVLIAIIIGVGVGTLTGLFPGIHINLVAAGLLALLSAGVLAGFAPLALAVFVVAMAVTHTFIDFIPSVLLGAPEEDSFLAVLPGHKLLKEGKGFSAIVLTLYGSLFSLAIVLIFAIFFIMFLSSIFEYVREYIPYVLIFASIYLVLRERDWVNAAVVFLFAGLLGWITFSIPVSEPLLPLLTGLFGVSGLIVSLQSKFLVPEQKIERVKRINLSKEDITRSLFGAGVAGPLSSFLPGMGSGHAAVIASEITGNEGRNPESFLFLVGAINTIVMALSFVTIYVIGRTRTGAAVAVNEILGNISTIDLVVILSSVVVSGIIAFFVGIYLANFFARRVSNIDYRKLSLVVMALLFLVNLFLSNWLGLIVLVTSSALGVFCILSGVRRINLMGALLVPTILFYLLG